ncbi:MAG: hypothetical protein HY074_05275 [Deltaproteobacteria bacterium]|nr:hypothetical protein [Deltaproteobacteria bacterium]
MKHLAPALLILASLVFLTPGLVRASEPVRDWTMLVFLNGNNNLDDWAKFNLLEMEQVGSSDRVNVVVQWASYERKKVDRRYIVKSNTPDEVRSPVLQDLGRADMGDWRQLVDFIAWGAANYPARHYLIDVWDHGTGWHENRARGVDISHDDFTHHWITTQQLGWVLRDAAKIIGHKVDVYASDACEMGMIEIASELAANVEIYAGSQIDIPLRGWPYAQILRKWHARKDTSAADIARLIASEYVSSFKGGVHGKKDATFSVYDLGKTQALTEAIALLGTRLSKLGSTTDRKKVNNARIEALTITNDYKDFLDFLEQLEKEKIEGLGQDVFGGVRRAAADYVIANQVTSGYPRLAKGISIWLPGEKKWFSKYLSQYNALNFSAATHWEDALKNLLLE